MAQFREELASALGVCHSRSGRFCFLTGRLFAPTLEEHVATVAAASPGWQGRVLPLANRFLGAGITVAGLLSGSDVRRGLAECREGEIPIIPDVMLGEDRNTFLDSVTVDELRYEVHPGLAVVAATAAGLLSAGERPTSCGLPYSSL